MLTDIETLLQLNKIRREESVYGNMPEELMKYPITIGDFTKPGIGENTAQQFAQLYEYQKKFHNKLHETEEYLIYDQRLRKLGRILKNRKVEKGDRTLSWEEKNIIKNEKRKLSRKKAEIQKKLEEQYIADYGYDYKNRPALLYKNTVYLTWFDDLQQLFPEMKRIRSEDIKSIPLFVSRMEKLHEAVNTQKSIGLVGGPCLFGVDEMLLELENTNGEKEIFDCSCGRRCLAQATTRGEEAIEDYIAAHPGETAAVRIINRKSGVTRQEYDSIRYLFAMGEVFRGKLVIPLPDMSYFKYMENSLEGLETELRENAMQEFKKECYAVTDLYLQIIEQVAAEYPEIEYRVLHHRDESFCKMFYEKRQKYIQGSSYMRKITDKDKKKEAVVDYITMLALPYYVYGTRYVIQVDSVDETDSGRKCNKIHGADMELIQLLYPEYLSSDGRHTIYNTSIEHKNYMV